MCRPSQYENFSCDNVVNMFQPSIFVLTIFYCFYTVFVWGGSSTYWYILQIIQDKISTLHMQCILNDQEINGDELSDTFAYEHIWDFASIVDLYASHTTVSPYTIIVYTPYILVCYTTPHVVLSEKFCHFRLCDGIHRNVHINW